MFLLQKFQGLVSWCVASWKLKYFLGSYCSMFLHIYTISNEGVKCVCRKNVGLLGLTKVGSSRVVQVSAGFMIFFSTLGISITNSYF